MIEPTATLEERALYIAEKANECCGRSDGYEEDIYKIALTLLQEVREECAKAAEWFSNVQGFTAADVAKRIRALPSTESPRDGGK